MNEHSKLSLDNIDSYMKSALVSVKEQLEKHYSDLSLVNIDSLDVDKINVYPRLKELRDLSHDDIFVLDDVDTTAAKKAILDGKIIFEHAFAGEATRLGLGTKYLIRPKDIDASVLDYSLGERHMMQLAYEIKKLAKEKSLDASEILSKQVNIVILNEKTYQDIIDNFIANDFFGFLPKNTLFMVQFSFNGMSIKDGELVYDKLGDKRLHNHGQMVMQKAHDNSLFYIDDNKKVYLSSLEFEDILTRHLNLMSFPIEDVGLLTEFLDLKSIAKSLELAKDGYEMVMEIVGQNKDNPQKGGAAFYDPLLKRNVMIESNRLLGLRNEEIKHLNKNVNHYPNPVKSFRALKNSGIHMCFAVKKSDKPYIYPCPVQGDINFLVKTAFVMRKKPKPIMAWKKLEDTDLAVLQMKKQDSVSKI